MIKHIIEFADTIVSVALGSLVIASLKFTLSINSIIIVLGMLGIILAVIEFLKQLFSTEHRVWQVISLLACVFSVFFSVLALYLIKFSYMPEIPFIMSFLEPGILLILAYIEIGQGLFWVIINKVTE